MFSLSTSSRNNSSFDNLLFNGDKTGQCFGERTFCGGSEISSPSGDNNNRNRQNESTDMDIDEEEDFDSKTSKTKTVTFNNEDLFNIYDNNISSSFDHQNSDGSLLADSSNIQKSLRVVSSPSLEKLSIQSSTSFKVPEIPVQSKNLAADLRTPSHNFSQIDIDPVTIAKLSSFSQRLRSLTSPATPLRMRPETPRSAKLTPRSNMVTPW